MKTLGLAIFCLFFLTGFASGDDSLTSLRCRGGLITLGVNKLEIINKCGQPVSKDVVQTGSTRYRREYVEQEEWSYNFGPNDFIHTLRLEGSTLIEIRRGSRGY